jgi:hypothetical protein
MKYDREMFEHVKKAYDMPFLKANMRVNINGRYGYVISHSNSGLRAKLDNGKYVSFHPTWETIYYDNQANVIKDYRGINKS